MAGAIFLSGNDRIGHFAGLTRPAGEPSSRLGAPRQREGQTMDVAIDVLVIILLLLVVTVLGVLVRRV
jgi:hypothetical protein